MTNIGVVAARRSRGRGRGQEMGGAASRTASVSDSPEMPLKVMNERLENLTRELKLINQNIKQIRQNVKLINQKVDVLLFQELKPSELDLTSCSGLREVLKFRDDNVLQFRELLSRKPREVDLTRLLEVLKIRDDKMLWLGELLRRKPSELDLTSCRILLPRELKLSDPDLLPELLKFSDDNASEGKST